MSIPTRAAICQSAATKLFNAPVKQFRTLLGLDGFVDSMIEVVDKRHSAAHYDRIKRIADFGTRITAASGQSSNYEFVITRQKLGGNGPIMSNAMSAVGFAVTCIGSLGYPSPHSVFQELSTRTQLLSIAEPGYTDAVEFADGKIMLNKNGALADVNWENLLARVGKEKLVSLCAEADLLGMLNWTMLPHLTTIWIKLMEEILPHLPAKTKRRKMFIDLADPEKRTLDDLRGALLTLAKFQPMVDVTLAMNLKESDQVAAALGISIPAHSEPAIEETARAIRAALNLSTVVIHPRKGAAAAATAAESTQFAGPFTESPKISTGAGDHFNAGFAIGQLLEFTLTECVAMGTAVSGFYVRNAHSATMPELITFLNEIPN